MVSDADLLAYLLRGLEDTESESVEAALENDPTHRQRLVMIRRFLAPLEADAEPPTPPPDLYIRTLRKVAALRSRQNAADSPSPRKAPQRTTVWPLSSATPEGAAVGKTRWRRVDVFVAAAVLFIIGLLLPYGLLYLRREQGISACADNLRRWHIAFRDYESRHDGYPPVVPHNAPFNFAGIYSVKLRSEAAWQTGASINCPANVPPEHHVAPPTEEELKTRIANGDDSWVTIVGGCYAYSLGYWARRGSELTIEQVNLKLSSPSMIPLLADRPARPKDPGYMPLANSPNHAYRGQNVLFLDGSVRFLRCRALPVGDDDIYLNKNKELAPGLDPLDAVLAPSETRLIGPAKSTAVAD